MFLTTIVCTDGIQLDETLLIPWVGSSRKFSFIIQAYRHAGNDIWIMTRHLIMSLLCHKVPEYVFLLENKIVVIRNIFTWIYI